jgi:hypothetical protein
MYGYASELLPLLQGLLGSDAQAAPNVDMSSAMPSSPNSKSAAPMPPRRPGNMSSPRSAPMPPRRPEGLLGSVSLAPQAPQPSQQDAIAAFLASQGIGQPQAQMPLAGMPRVDSGPAAGPAQGPGPMQAAMQPPVNPPLPPHRPQMGPPMPMGLQGLALPRGATALSQGPGPVMQSNTPEDPRLAWLRSQLYGG